MWICKSCTHSSTTSSSSSWHSPSHSPSLSSDPSENYSTKCKPSSKMFLTIASSDTSSTSPSLSSFSSSQTLLELSMQSTSTSVHVSILLCRRSRNNQKWTWSIWYRKTTRSRILPWCPKRAQRTIHGIEKHNANLLSSVCLLRFPKIDIQYKKTIKWRTHAVKSRSWKCHTIEKRFIRRGDSRKIKRWLIWSNYINNHSISFGLIIFIVHALFSIKRCNGCCFLDVFTRISEKKESFTYVLW